MWRRFMWDRAERIALKRPKESQSVVAEDLSFLTFGNVMALQNFAHGIPASFVVRKVRRKQGLWSIKPRDNVNVGEETISLCKGRFRGIFDLLNTTLKSPGGPHFRLAFEA
jgi:hypothetical protein